MRNRGILVVILILLLFFAVDCGMKKVDDPNNGDILEVPLYQDEIEETDTIVYEDESQKTVSYGHLSFGISPYHISKKTEDNGVETFYCEIDSDREWRVKNKTITIQKCSEIDVKTVEEAIQYFNEFGTYYKLESYQNIEDSSGITQIYKAVGDMSYYLVYCNDEIYLIESDDNVLVTDLLKRYRWDLITAGIYKNTIECGNEVTVEIEENISYQDKAALYEINTDKEKYKAVVNIVEGEAKPYQYTFTLCNAVGKEIQTLNWESNVEEYPVFLDVNLDGWVDIRVVEYQWPSYSGHIFYTWNIEENCYQKVEYENILAEIQVNDGYLLNWVRNGINCYVIEKLVWDGNKLIKESEEVVRADE